MTKYITIQEDIPNATQIAESTWLNYLNQEMFKTLNMVTRIKKTFEMNYAILKQTPIKNIKIWKDIFELIKADTPSMYGTTLRIVYELMEKSHYNLESLREFIYHDDVDRILDMLNYNLPEELKSLVPDVTPELINNLIGDTSTDRILIVINHGHIKLNDLVANKELGLLFQQAYTKHNIEKVLRIEEISDFYAFDLISYKNNYKDYVSLFNTDKDIINFLIGSIEIMNTYIIDKNNIMSVVPDGLNHVTETLNTILSTFENLYPTQYQLYKTLKALDTYDYGQLSTIIQEQVVSNIESFPLPLM